MLKMNINDLTESAQKMVKTNTGYRCLDQIDGENHTPVEVFDFEINDLENDDIPDTIEDLYGVKTKGDPEEIDKFVKKALDTDFYHICWLASDPLDAVEYYSDFHKRFNTLEDAVHDDGTPISVRKYTLPEHYIILSDVDTDGQLIAWSDGEYLVSKEINKK